MPATNPRLTITLQPSIAAQLRRISELTGNSQSSLIADILEGSSPMFERLITLLTAASDVKAALTSEVRDNLADAQGKLEAQLGLALSTWDAGAKPLLDQAEKITRRASQRAAKGGPSLMGVASPSAAATPLSNRGVRSPRKTPKKPTRRRT